MKNSCIINALKKYTGLKKNKEIADLLGISALKLGNWIHNDSINIYVVKKSFPEIDSNWLMDPKGPVKTISNLKEVIGIPFIPIDAIAGYAPEEFIDIPPEEIIYVPEFQSLGAEFCVPNTGKSMEPRFQNGDILGCKGVDINDFNQWGRIYVLDTTQGVLVKRLKPGAKETTVLCVSDNPDFPPFEIKKKDIRSIGLVLGGITFE